METTEFRRNVGKLVNVKAHREGFKAITRKPNDLKVAYATIELNAAVGRLMHDFQGYILGIQLNPTMKAKGVDALGSVLHHAHNVAKTLKVKVPGAKQRIKPANTYTFLLTEIERISTEMLGTVFGPVGSVTAVPMSDEEVAAAKKKGAALQKAKKAKKVDALKAESTPKAEKKYEKLVAKGIDYPQVRDQVSALLKTTYEFIWGVYGTAAKESPVTKIMGQHIEALKPQFPQGFFDAPPKKKAPAKKAAPKQEEQAAAVH